MSGVEYYHKTWRMNLTMSSVYIYIKTQKKSFVDFHRLIKSGWVV